MNRSRPLISAQPRGPRGRRRALPEFARCRSYPPSAAMRFGRSKKRMMMERLAPRHGADPERADQRPEGSPALRVRVCRAAKESFADLDLVCNQAFHVLNDVARGNRSDGPPVEPDIANRVAWEPPHHERVLCLSRVQSVHLDITDE